MTYNVAASGITFAPATLNVHTGDVVHWSFSGTHDVTSGANCTSDSKFYSGTKNSGDTYDFTFSTAGTFPYYCSFHCSLGMVGSITVLVASGIETGSMALSLLKSYPNPFSGNTNLQYDLSKSAKVNIDITNFAGQKVLEMEFHETAGTHLEVLELSKMAKGLYILHLHLDGIPAKEAILVKE